MGIIAPVSLARGMDCPDESSPSIGCCHRNKAAGRCGDLGLSHRDNGDQSGKDRTVPIETGSVRSEQLECCFLSFSRETTLSDIDQY